MFEYLCFNNLLEIIQNLKEFWKVVLNLVILFVFPASVGFSFGKIITCTNISTKLGINHPIDSSWDYKFSKMPAYTDMIIILKTDEIIKGRFSGESFASSDCENRDIYLSIVYNEDWEMDETYNRGILIIAENIKTIEFLERKLENVK